MPEEPACEEPDAKKAKTDDNQPSAETKDVIEAVAEAAVDGAMVVEEKDKAAEEDAKIEVDTTEKKEHWSFKLI